MTLSRDSLIDVILQAGVEFAPPGAAEADAYGAAYKLADAILRAEEAVGPAASDPLTGYAWHQTYEVVKAARDAAESELHVCTCPRDPTYERNPECWYALGDAEQSRRFAAAVITRMETGVSLLSADTPERTNL